MNTKVKSGYVTVICKNPTCKCEFQARKTDRKRGWGLYCSKSCKAVVQEKKTGQYKRHKNSNFIDREEYYHYAALADMEAGWDGHKNAF